MTAPELNRQLNPITLVLGISVAASWLFALVAGGAASEWDEALLSVLRQHRHNELVDLAWALTWLGDWLVLVPVALAAAGVLLWRNLRTEAVVLLAIVAVVRVLVSFQKVWFERARPGVEHWMVEISNSFPSAHAANSFATYVAIAILLDGSRTAVGLAIAISFLVGATRIVLGVHWPSDVIGGWAFAAFAMLPLWRFRYDRGRHDVGRGGARFPQSGF